MRRISIALFAATLVVSCKARPRSDPTTDTPSVTVASTANDVAAHTRRPEGSAQPTEKTWAPDMNEIKLAEFCVTHGAIRSTPDGMVIDDPEVRAVAPGTGTPAELRFRYLGLTSSIKPLSSGAVRTQIGLKLRAQDGCNLVYVMWRLTPDAKLVVSIKRNPGKRVSAECGVSGYVNLRPRREAGIPTVTLGGRHTLRAEIKGTDLEVWADGISVWQGPLGGDAFSFDGPSGLRTDNGRFDVSFVAARGPGLPGPCSAGSGSD